MKHLELFSWIGWFRYALELLSKDFSFPMKNVWYSEIDKFATETYKSYYDTNNEICIWDIVSYVDDWNISKIDDINILSWWFPCQPFSSMWLKKWFSDDRGNLFFYIEKILKEKNPNFFLLENVKNIKTHDNWNTLKVILKSLKKLWYKYVKYDVFNTSNFWLPQHRRRVFIFWSKVDLDIDFSENKIIESFNALEKSSVKKYENVLDVLDKEVDDKYYLSEKIKKTILSHWSGWFKSKSEINQLIARPLTATMNKMHRACQDNYYSDKLIQKWKKFYKESTKLDPYWEKIRRLTPKEALLLQWFPKKLYKKAKDNWLSDTQLYRQAWNAISVNVVYAICYYMFIKNDLKKYL